MTVALLVVTHLVAAAAGAFGWPHVSTLIASWKASKALANAQALLASEAAHAAAVAAAHATVAAAPVAPVSAAGTSAPAAGAAPTH